MNSTSALDWTLVRKQLSTAEESLANALEFNAEERSRLLSTRARQLAARRTEAPTIGGELDVISFQLGTERYGIPISAVRAVVPYRTLGGVPEAPAELLGMLAERGEIWAIYSLSALLSLTDAGSSDAGSALLLMRHSRMRLGLATGRIHGIRTLARSELNDPVRIGTVGDERTMIRGVTEDSLALLDDNELWSHSSILEVLT